MLFTPVDEDREALPCNGQVNCITDYLGRGVRMAVGGPDAVLVVFELFGRIRGQMTEEAENIRGAFLKSDMQFSQRATGTLARRNAHSVHAEMIRCAVDANDKISAFLVRRTSASTWRGDQRKISKFAVRLTRDALRTAFWDVFV